LRFGCCCGCLVVDLIPFHEGFPLVVVVVLLFPKVELVEGVQTVLVCSSRRRKNLRGSKNTAATQSKRDGDLM
jgi:hypothetical protein